ncbi:hypothetical protein Fcan01_05649 [Folsomia candida]|uniref:Uncharacterized protein n=1 Tax=Folsomia candida TaxID=158441 RepID=A0A226ES76_FOLCA|nr:hypothetical protein Fcan01_05649 [Folsomia candida]
MKVFIDELFCCLVGQRIEVKKSDEIECRQQVFLKTGMKSPPPPSAMCESSLMAPTLHEFIICHSTRHRASIMTPAMDDLKTWICSLRARTSRSFHAEAPFLRVVQKDSKNIMLFSTSL